MKKILLLLSCFVFSCSSIGQVTHPFGQSSVASITSGTIDGAVIGGVTPAAGTFTTISGAGTGLTGTAASLTSGTVTTNANLTGVITSVGNATSIASQTGTGTKFVVDTSPTLVTPVLGVASATSINFGGTTLSNYLEGAWTPIDSSGASLSLTVSSAVYTRIGRVVYFETRLTYPTTASGATAIIGGLPLTSGAQDYAISVYPNTGTAIDCYVTASSTTMTCQNLVGGTPITNANLTGATLRVTGFYFL